MTQHKDSLRMAMKILELSAYVEKNISGSEAKGMLLASLIMGYDYDLEKVEKHLKEHKAIMNDGKANEQ